MSDQRDPDGPPADVMDVAFTVPAHIAGTKWEPVYNEMLDRMRREASGLTMNTVQILLIERIARFYVDMRLREDDGTQAQLSVKDQKEFNSFWLSMTQEFNKQLLNGQEKVREALVLEIQKILSSRLPLVKDDTERKNLRRALQEDFASLRF